MGGKARRKGGRVGRRTGLSHRSGWIKSNLDKANELLVYAGV